MLTGMLAHCSKKEAFCVTADGGSSVRPTLPSRPPRLARCTHECARRRRPVGHSFICLNALTQRTGSFPFLLESAVETMAHRYSQPSYSAADAYSPPLSSSTAPMLGNDQYGSEQGRTQKYPSSDDNDSESEGEGGETKEKGVG